MNGRWALRTVIGIVILCAWIPVAFAEEGASAQEERSALDKDLDKVWGKERDIKVIQKRVFEKDKRHEVGLLLGAIPNDSFFNFFPVGLRYAYFPLESVAVEFSGAYVASSQSQLQKDIKSFSTAIKTVKLGDRVEWYAGVNAHWIPIHAKVSILNKKLTSLDLGVTIGFGLIGSKVNEDNKWETRWSYDHAIPFNIQMNIGLSLHWFLTDYLAIRLDYRNYIFPAYPGSTSVTKSDGSVVRNYNSEWGDVRSLSEISIGLSYLSPAPK
jgi:outer membrane beta-barrel protein